MFITYFQKGGIEYARLETSQRIKEAEPRFTAAGKRIASIGKTFLTLGRVLDKDRGIFRSRERGVFQYDLASNTYSPPPAEYVPPPLPTRGKYRKVGRKRYSRLVLQFGDVFFFNEFLKMCGLLPAIEAISYGNPDTLQALLCYYVTSTEANRHAEIWYDLSYARILWPRACLSSQRISEALHDLGLEEHKREFFSRFYEFVRQHQPAMPAKPDYGMSPDESGGGILLDSTGLPNESKLPVTAVNNHNGIISEEVRLIYVVQQGTGLPLYYRYVSGNVIDATTVKRTVAELKAMHINVKFALLDAGYYNGVNADTLLDAQISFVTRVHSGHKIYKDAVESCRDKLECGDNCILHHGRMIYIQEVDVMLGSQHNRPAYGYLCLDVTIQTEARKSLQAYAVDNNLKGTEIHAEYKQKGLFMLVATRKIKKDNILSLYYTRNQVEEIFKIGKDETKMVPVGVSSEQALRGHLLLTFISTTVLKLLADRLKDTKYTVPDVLTTLRHQLATIYEDALVTSEEIKMMRDVYKLFRLECPAQLPYQPTEDELNRM